MHIQLNVVSRQNAIRVENGAIRLVPRIEKRAWTRLRVALRSAKVLFRRGPGHMRRTYIRMGEELSGSGSPIVTMMQPAQSILRKDAPRGCGANSVVGGSLPQPKMRAVFVIVADIFGEQTFQMAFVHRNHLIQQISSAAFDPSLLSFAKSLCPTLKVLPSWRKLFGLGLQADSSTGDRCSQKARTVRWPDYKKNRLVIRNGS
jgi:hypothetical protein